MTGAGTTTTTKEYGPQNPVTQSTKMQTPSKFTLLMIFLFGSLTVSPGIRYTSIDYQYSGANDRTLSETLAGIGAGYEVSESLNLFAGVYQGQTFPDAQSASSSTSKGLRNQETSLNL